MSRRPEILDRTEGLGVNAPGVEPRKGERRFARLVSTAPCAFVDRRVGSSTGPPDSPDFDMQSFNFGFCIADQQKTGGTRYVKRGALLLALLLANGCGGAVEPDRPSTRPPDQKVDEQNELVENTRNVSEMVCEDSGAKKTAKEFGVSDPTDLDAIARAFAEETSTEGPHREAGYVGCLKGLMKADS